MRSMLEVLLLFAAFLVPVFAARKGRRRRSGGIKVIRVNGSQALSTLASNTVLAAGIQGATLTRAAYMISADLYVTLRNHTAGEGPIAWGVAHSDYSVTEIQEALTSDALDTSDLIAGERARRLVRDGGIFSGLNTEEAYNNGQVKRVRIRFTINAGQDLQIWFWNMSGAALNTGTVVEWYGKLYIRQV